MQMIFRGCSSKQNENSTKNQVKFILTELRLSKQFNRNFLNFIQKIPNYEKRNAVFFFYFL